MPNYVISSDFHPMFSVSGKTEEDLKLELIEIFKKEGCPKPKSFTESVIRFSHPNKTLVHFRNVIRDHFNYLISCEIFEYSSVREHNLEKDHEEGFDEDVNAIYDEESTDEDYEIPEI